ncbi:MAG: PhzF family phenazine biosynthesis protein [Erysipelotrichaceae bacterium]|nr:PhzF family phenazine biosynthesis protein [Erysipelotrichaceae bacterium]
MKYYIVDVFAEEKYQGNQLLVVLAEEGLSSEEQQAIAKEINFAETTFILGNKQGNGGYNVRIWTAGVGEVPFAGHPTLGTAYVIHHFLEHEENNKVILNLKVGPIPVTVNEKGLTMSQNPPVFEDCVSREDICTVFNLSPEDIREDLPLQRVSTGLAAIIVPLTSREALKKVFCDQRAFKEYITRCPHGNRLHLFFTETADHLLAARCLTEDFLEDAATGSANGDLAGYLLQYRYWDEDEISYTVHQGEDMGRPSCLYIHAKKDPEWVIEVSGNCFLVAEGEWY